MNILKTLIVIFLFIAPNWSMAQLGETFDITRPEKYEDKKIGYEKTYTKKFGLPRRFLQNTTSHYNFFFNANEKIKDIIARAKEAQKDTFDRLLNYYPYNLSFTKQQKTDLDSVIEKATTGILTHDLRSNWVDNFYLLIGKAYLLRQQYDSAEMTFNYINYEYAPKTKDKERILTGSRDEDVNGSSIFSIATKEKKSLTAKLFQRPPSRNEAFLWMIRTYIENEDYGSASGMVQTLKNDPIFPKRLQNDLDELTGYLFYSQKIYDSAAHYTVLSLSKSESKNDRARREFLAGQLYELGNSPNLASEYYAKSVKHTLDPVMEVYARLNAIKIRKSDDPKVVEENIAALLKMARKDAYTDYKDIIYFFAAKMELEVPKMDAAKTYFLKSTIYATNNTDQRNKSFLALADIAYKEKDYRNASSYYDSLNLANLSMQESQDILIRKDNLKNLVTLLDVVETEDSLQTIANLAEKERDEYLRKLLRKLRKERGLKEEISFGSGSNAGFSIQTPPVNLFEPNSGEWYFYNNSQKVRGLNEFRKKWGNRPNVDGWRLTANINAGNNPTPRKNNNTPNAAIPANSKKNIAELNMEALLANLPLSDSAIRVSNDTIQASLLSIAKIYQYELEDTKLAIETYENLLKRFPKNPKIDEIYYNLYLSYKKIGDEQKAAQYKQLLEKKDANSNYLTKINNPTAAKNEDPNFAATKAYNDIYNLYVEGKFEEAIALKKQADTKYGNNFWTQQLLYIESVYYIKQRQDSTALISLNNAISLNATSPLGIKATRLKEVVLRRAEIENELKNLQVTRATEIPIVIDNTPTVKNNPAPPKPTTVTTPVTVPAQQPVVINNTPKPKDSVKLVTPTPKKLNYIYKTDTLKQHYVGVILNKVDNIFVNEARNAFVIYNRGTGRTLSVDPTPIDADNKILLIGAFTNAKEALQYIQTANPKAATEIVPWLAKEKYSFIIVSDENLQLVQKNKDIPNYKSFLSELFPGKF
jgi:tetratricopeptide (TPR) repeat protein